nr:hypothetical protein GCM10025699_77570 [Microbacterium flavescens]
MRHRTRTTRVAALATVMIAGVALTGCSADAGGPDVVQLDFWGWGTGQSEQVARFNAAHPRSVTPMRAAETTRPPSC